MLEILKDKASSLTVN